VAHLSLTQRIIPLDPRYYERVWGGQTLKPADPPIGEAWIAFEKSVARSGPWRGRTIGELALTQGSMLLGNDVARRYGSRFPLLVKLLDCADWLSVQVHPDDERARAMVGPDEFGKTEAWNFLEVAPGARILAGVQPGTRPEDLAGAIRDGRVLEIARRIDVHAGDTVFIPAGTLHALGPGLLLYEVQQASDTTYRVYDWDRPASAGRKLHLEESVGVTNVAASPTLTPLPALVGTAAAATAVCDYFQLDVLQIADRPFAADTDGRSFHILTVVDGSVEVVSQGEAVHLQRYDTALVAGGAGAYTLRVDRPPARVLRAAVPTDGTMAKS
jgi:mannose-6-phosphate isomerase